MKLLIDNYDSFSYNLYQLLGTLTDEIRVVRNDVMTIDEIEALAPTHIFLSPGPGRPADAGVCVPLVQRLGGKIPIFGVCLGHQAICEAYGATIAGAKQLMHGKVSRMSLDNASVLFCGMANTMDAARYHSLAAVRETLPPCLRVTAETADGEVMAVEHAQHAVYGVQFHPESILTNDGAAVLKNFLEGGKLK